MTTDTDDVRADKSVIAKLNGAAIPWRWYEEVRRQKSRRPRRASSGAALFRLCGKEPEHEFKRARITAFYSDVAHGRLPDRGLFYLKAARTTRSGSNRQTAIRTCRRRFRRRRPSGLHRFANLRGVRRIAVSAIAHSKYWHDWPIVIMWTTWAASGITSRRKTSNAAPTGILAATVRAFRLIVISPFAKTAAVVTISTIKIRC